MPKKNKSLIICFILTFLIAAGSILLPGHMLQKHAQARQLVVKTAPRELYLSASSAMAVKASSQLSELDRIKLISGAWDSEQSLTSPNENTLSQVQAVTLARESIELLYHKKVYPYSLESAYNNWYTWEAELYAYTDATFKTYTSYAWLLTFTKYDGSLTHQILMTENGTILEAQVNDNSQQTANIISCYNNVNIARLLHEDNLSITDSTVLSALRQEDTYPMFSHADISFSHMYSLVLQNAQGDSEKQYLYQYASDNRYGIGIIAQK